MSDEHYLWAEDFREAIAAKHPGVAQAIMAQRVDLLHLRGRREMADFKHTEAVAQAVIELGGIDNPAKDIVNGITANAAEKDAQEAKWRPQSALREAWDPAVGLATVLTKIVQAVKGSNRDHNKGVGLG
jgi:hypothetical protein